TGWSQKRRLQRIREFIERVHSELIQHREAVREDYLRSDEFEDLLDQTMRRGANERHNAKRRLFAAFLAGAILTPGAPYHEHLRHLRTLDELQTEHVRSIHAMLQEPGPTPPGTGGISTRGLTSIGHVLRERLPDIPPRRLTDLVMQLIEDLRIVTFGRGLNTM